MPEPVEDNGYIRLKRWRKSKNKSSCLSIFRIVEEEVCEIVPATVTTTVQGTYGAAEALATGVGIQQQQQQSQRLQQLSGYGGDQQQQRVQTVAFGGAATGGVAGAVGQAFEAGEGCKFVRDQVCEVHGQEEVNK